LHSCNFHVLSRWNVYERNCCFGYWLAKHPTNPEINKNLMNCLTATYSINKRIIGFFCKVCQSCTRIYYCSSITWCRKYWWVNWQCLSIDSYASQIQVIVWSESLYIEMNQTNIITITCFQLQDSIKFNQDICTLLCTMCTAVQWFKCKKWNAIRCHFLLFVSLLRSLGGDGRGISSWGFHLNSKVDA